MDSEPAHLVDTNIFLRLTRKNDPQYDLVRTAVDALTRHGSQQHYSLQAIAEFWNVCTRPVDRNGLGLNMGEVSQRVAAIEQRMTLLPDDERVYSSWRQLVETHQVRGVQVHDARLAALMKVHGVTHILTLNPADFSRYPFIVAVHPKQIQP